MNIRPTGAGERNLGGLDFFFLWAGVAISLAEIWAGGFLAPMGFWPAFWAIVLGHIVGNTFMALGGVIGSDHGIMSMVSVRPSFGIRGSALAALLNILQLVCWASIMLIIGGRAGVLLGRAWGGPFASEAFWIVLMGLGTLAWALATGKSAWKKMQAVAVVGLLGVLVLLSARSYTALAQRGVTKSLGLEPVPFMIGLDLVIAMPISWLPLVADYSRFAKSTFTSFWSTWWGYFFVSSWMYLLGLAATLVTGRAEPHLQILTLMGGLGLAVPALFMVVFSTITSDFPDVYSATCSVLNISSKVSAKTIMVLTGLASVVVALAFPMERYEGFLLQIGAMFVPLFGVVLADYFLLRRRSLETGELYEKSSRYWYGRGFNAMAILCWVAGWATYEIVALTELPVGGSLPSLFVAGLLYVVLTRRRRGAAAQPPPPSDI